MKLLIAGGGTGGHVFPALAVAREWLSRGEDREVVFVGTQRGIEARLVPEAGFPLETIRSAGLKGIGGVRFARNVAKLAPAMWDSFSILRRHKFRAALGITVMILSQTMINLGVVLGMMPTKGIPLPFISYGGSSLLVMLLATGVLLNISRQAD